jgi:hypothetical protein
MKCPICERVTFTHTEDRTPEGVLLEEEALCSDDHHEYRYHYHYGHTEEKIGVAYFHSFHSDNREEIKHKQFIRKATVYYERLWYEKSKGKQA